MNNISIQSDNSLPVTIVSNTFIDKYMPHANGACVKVYFYLLRHLAPNAQPFTIAAASEQLDETEKDILRALAYWEKLNLLSVSYDTNNEVTSIRITDLDSVASENTSRSVSTPSAIITTMAAPSAGGDISLSDISHVYYSDEQLAVLKENDDIEWLLDIIPSFLERMLKPQDVQLVVYLYEQLKFSKDLILYLFEYCAEKGKKKTDYIETVALNWHSEGVTTIAEAQESSEKYGAYNIAVYKAFGLNRSFGDAEKKLIKSWSTLGLSPELIAEACSRTLLNIQKPDFTYANKIITSWANSGVKTKADIAALENARKASAKSPAAASREQARNVNVLKNTSNKFNAYVQRSYSLEDYDQLEKKLLKR